MAGVYGSINSREDFFLMLRDVQHTTQGLIQCGAEHPVFLSIQKQLDAIDGWTRGGRRPTREERSSLDMGLRAVRELSDTGNPAMDVYTEKIGCLHSYFEDWPTDEQATSASDDDPFGEGWGVQ